MKKSDFLTAVRKGGAKFRADNIVIATGAGDLRGKGVVEVAEGRFRIHVTVDNATPPPESPMGIMTRKDLWGISGVIEDEIHFSTQDLPHNESRNYTFGQPWRSSLEFSPNCIELAPTGMDCLTRQELYELQQQANRQAGVIEVASEGPTVVASGVSRPSVRVTFHAVLPNFKLIERNAGTQTTRKNVFLGESTSSKSDTFHGQVSGWEYGLVERDGDLDVHFLSKAEHRSLGEDHDWRLFRAFRSVQR